MSNIQTKYLQTVYNEKDRPFTDYPAKLALHLFQQFGMKPGQKLLEVGCGRGEFSQGFLDLGIEVYAVDQSDFIKTYAPGVNFKSHDLENGTLPYEDNSFDFVYSKSVIEHFYYPEKLMKEIFRVLRSGGIAITMTPSWEENVRNFYEDFTHRTPFTSTSLHDLKLIVGFTQVRVEKFIQLPLTWKFPSLKPITKIVACITPSSLKKYKFIRFSKEIMLLGHGTRR